MARTPSNMLPLGTPAPDFRLPDTVSGRNFGLDELRGESGTAILFISADLDEVIDRSDRIAVFSGGKMSRIVNASETTVDELGHLIGGQE